MQRFIFEAAQTDIGLREEIARATGRVKEREARELVAEFLDFGFFRLIDLIFYLDIFKLVSQFVEEQWVDDLVNVLY